MIGFVGVFLAVALAASDGLMLRYADRLPAGRSVRFCTTADTSPKRYAVAAGADLQVGCADRTLSLADVGERRGWRLLAFA